MAQFDSKETEEYFYEISRKYSIIHVSWEKNHIVTKEDVDGLADVHEKYRNGEVESAPFEESP